MKQVADERARFRPLAGRRAGAVCHRSRPAPGNRVVARCGLGVDQQPHRATPWISRSEPAAHHGAARPRPPGPIDAVGLRMTDLAWWQQGVIYQIYPRSFADSDGDGIGDLRGVEAHVDYLNDLGVVALWLSPIFPSPMADFGYDVSDYCDIDPVFGSLADLDALVAACHARGIRVVLDWVLNHTSDRHPWFVASLSSRDDPRRDWYVWRDGAPGGGPPNNWTSAFASVGRAWTFDAPTGQWYLHSFLPEQPDLNWDNPQVEAAMHDVLRFWLDRGIDGFRLDAIPKIAKDPLLRDNAGGALRHHEDWDTIHDRLRGIRTVVDEYPE